MKIHIVKEKDNPYMKRREVTVAVDHIGGATPSLAGLQQLLAREWSVAAEMVDIKQILSLHGRSQSKAKVHVWQEPRVKDLMKAIAEAKVQANEASKGSEATAASKVSAEAANGSPAGTKAEAKAEEKK